MPEYSRKKKDQAVNLETLMGNKPPQALDVEAAVLGAMLVEPSTIDESMEELTASCFYDPKHRMIFEAMSSLVNEHVAIDLISVSEKLRTQGNLEAVGGPVVLADLSQNIGAAAHIEFYLKILKQKTIQRDLITASYEILKESFDETVIVDNLIDDAQTKVFQAIQTNDKHDVKDIGSIINSVMDNLQELQKITGPSGVPGPHHPGGPSVRGQDRLRPEHRPQRGGGPQHAGGRLLPGNVGRPAGQASHHHGIRPLRREDPRRREAGALRVGAARVHAQAPKAPLYIDDTPGIPIMEFRAKAKRLVKQKQVRLIVVDYLQLMQGPVELRGLREQEVAAISRTLKATAKELNIPIIALSQLSRDVVKRTGGLGKPQLSDLRESGSIEQDADMVIFIHRPEFTGMSEDPADKEKAWIVIAKHRNGEVCDIEMKYKAGQVKFVEPDQSLDIQAQRPYVSAASEPAASAESYSFDDPNQPF